MPDERGGYTLAQLRAFHDGKALDLAADKARRGAWAGEDLAREAYEATVRLIDRIAGDAAIVERLKGK